MKQNGYISDKRSLGMSMQDLETIHLTKQFNYLNAQDLILIHEGLLGIPLDEAVTNDVFGIGGMLEKCKNYIPKREEACYLAYGNVSREDLHYDPFVMFKAIALFLFILHEAPFPEKNFSTAFIATTVFLNLNGHDVISPTYTDIFTLIRELKQTDHRSDSTFGKKGTVPVALYMSIAMVRMHLRSFTQKCAIKNRAVETGDVSVPLSVSRETFQCIRHNLNRFQTALDVPTPNFVYSYE